MKIFIDIGHPAHVHYFKNFYHEMINRGHEFFITSRNKECTHELLEHYKIPFKSRGKGGVSFLSKLRYMFKADYLLYRYAKEFNPDLFLSFCSPYAAQVSFLLGKPHIAFDDTEHAKLAHLMFVPFTDTICTPYSFSKNLGKKQVVFDGFMELCSLHPNRFKPDSSVLKMLGVEAEEKYVILRFVSWEASHDGGATGIPSGEKRALVEALSNYAKVFISSERKLSEDLESYNINLPADKIHHALYYANLLISEGATMAAESAILGTPSLYVNSLKTGYNQMLSDFKLLYDYRNFSGVEAKALEIISGDEIKTEHRENMKSFIAGKIDVTSFMICFTENYPKSKQKLNRGETIKDKFKIDYNTEENISKPKRFNILKAYLKRIFGASERSGDDGNRSRRVRSV